MGPAHWDPKAISPFALPGVKKHRLFEELARSFCGLDRQGKKKGRRRSRAGPILRRGRHSTIFNLCCVVEQHARL